MSDPVPVGRATTDPPSRKEAMLNVMAEMRVCLDCLDALGASVPAAHLETALLELGKLFICEEN